MAKLTYKALSMLESAKQQNCMNEYTWPHAELAAPDLEQPDDARVAVHMPPDLPAYSSLWPYAELEKRRDSRVYDLLQKQKAITEKIREENKQIAAERTNKDKQKNPQQGSLA